MESEPVDESDLKAIVRAFRASVSEDQDALHRRVIELTDELRQRITTTETAMLNAIRDSSQRTDRRLTMLEKDMAFVQHEVGGLREDVGGLKVDVAALQEDVTGLKVDVGALQEDVTGLKVDVGALREDVTGLKVDVAALQEDVGSLKDDMRDVKAGVEELLRR